MVLYKYNRRTVMGYSICPVGGSSSLYLFGGSCVPGNCYHNDLVLLDTISSEWKTVECTNSPATSPMKKNGHGMISFTSDEHDYLFVFGGVGPTPTFTPSHHGRQYVPSPVVPDGSYTNEAHILCVTPFPGNWTVPVFTSVTPPPMVFFTLNRISHGKGILFGGLVHNGGSTFQRVNDAYILSLTKDQVDFQKLKCSSSVRPKARSGHSSTVVAVNSTVYLLVIGGRSDDLDPVNDSWILDIAAGQWKKVDVPESVSMRYDHSVAILSMTHNRVWIIVNGGCDKYNKPDNTNTFITGINVTMLVELVFGDNNWSVVNTWNTEQMSSEKSVICCQLALHMVNENHDTMRGTMGTIMTWALTELQTMMESAPSQLKLESELRQACQAQKEINKRLKSDWTLSKEGYMKVLLDKDQQLKQRKELEEVQRKMLLEMTVELERIKSDHEGKDKLEIMREAEIKRLQVELSNEQMKTISLNDKQTKDASVQCTSLPSGTSIIDKQMTDFGVQFSYVSLETDCLQGVTVFTSKLFTVRGNQPHTFIWEGFGFQLHVPEEACFPNEECDIMIDAVVGGPFQFPLGVEPVSAIFLISVAAKLRQPSLLKIQHCVSVDKSGRHSPLSFYRASLKEPTPPYHFRKVRGGRFDLNNQYGELELPVFCAMVIGSDQSSTSSEDTNSDSAQSITEGTVTDSSGIVSDIEQHEQSIMHHLEPSTAIRSLVDSGINFHAQAFYFEKELNHWEMKFIVVKHLEAFKKYVSNELQGHEKSIELSLKFNAENIELSFAEDITDDKYKGWTVEPLVKPCADSCIPPTRWIDVSGDNSVSEYQKILRYPVQLKKAMTGNDFQEPTLLIKRTMKEKADLLDRQTTLSSSQSVVNSTPGASTKESAVVKSIISVVKDVLIVRGSSLRLLLKPVMKEFTTGMTQARLITDVAANSLEYQTIMNDFLSCLEYSTTKEEVEEECSKLLGILKDIGGPCEKASRVLTENIVEAASKKKLTIELSLL